MQPVSGHHTLQDPATLGCLPGIHVSLASFIFSRGSFTTYDEYLRGRGPCQESGYLAESPSEWEFFPLRSVEQAVGVERSESGLIHARNTDQSTGLFEPSIPLSSSAESRDRLARLKSSPCLARLLGRWERRLTHVWLRLQTPTTVPCRKPLDFVRRWTRW